MILRSRRHQNLSGHALDLSHFSWNSKYTLTAYNICLAVILNKSYRILLHLAVLKHSIFIRNHHVIIFSKSSKNHIFDSCCWKVLPLIHTFHTLSMHKQNSLVTKISMITKPYHILHTYTWRLYKGRRKFLVSLNVSKRIYTCSGTWKHFIVKTSGTIRIVMDPKTGPSRAVFCVSRKRIG